MATIKAVLSGHGRNANAIIAQRAANRFSGAHKGAEPAKNLWLTNSTAHYK
jgi:hypothetical protein